MGEQGGVGSGGNERVAEAVIFVFGDGHTGRVDVLPDVAVSIVKGMIDARVGSGFESGGEQAADAACALEAAGEVGAPEVGFFQGDGGRCAGGVDGSAELGDGIPAVVEPVGPGAADCPGDAATEGVIVILDGGAAGRRGLDELVVAVPGERRIRGGGDRQRTGGHVPVEIVGGVES
jgi:hypothetical protein